MVLTIRRSEFVSIVAWVFIVLAAISFTSGGSAVVRALVATYDAPENESASVDYPMGSFLGWGLEVTPPRFQILYALWTLLSLLVLVTSVGLARRRHWARRAFIFWMGVGALLTALGTVNSIWALFAIGWIASPGGKFVLYVLQVLDIIMGMGLVATFIWIVRRLREPNVVAEFQ